MRDRGGEDRVWKTMKGREQQEPWEWKVEWTLDVTGGRDKKKTRFYIYTYPVLGSRQGCPSSVDPCCHTPPLHTLPCPHPHQPHTSRGPHPSGAALQTPAGRNKWRTPRGKSAGGGGVSIYIIEIKAMERGRGGEGRKRRNRRRRRPRIYQSY